MQDAKSEQTSRPSDCLGGGVSAGALPISSTCSGRAARRSTGVHGRVPAQTPKTEATCESGMSCQPPRLWPTS